MIWFGKQPRIVRPRSDRSACAAESGVQATGRLGRPRRTAYSVAGRVSLANRSGPAGTGHRRDTAASRPHRSHIRQVATPGRAPPEQKPDRIDRTRRQPVPVLVSAS